MVSGSTVTFSEFIERSSRTSLYLQNKKELNSFPSLDSHRPILADSLGKLPDDPQVAEPLDSAKSIGIPIGGLENDGGMNFFHQSALTWNAEFGVEIAVHPCNKVHLYAHISVSAFFCICYERTVLQAMRAVPSSMK